MCGEPVLTAVTETAASTSTRRTRTAAIGALGALGIAAGAVFGVSAATGSTTTAWAGVAPASTSDPVIRVAADVDAGDSGGPLYDAGGEVIGMDTAAASTGGASVAGDVITGIDGTTIASADDVTTALSGYEPGDSESASWSDTAGRSQTATVVLGTGPAD